MTLTRAFLIGQTEVTVEQWTAAGLPMPNYPPQEGGCGVPPSDFPCAEPCLEPSCPVAGVSWYEVLAYANLLSDRHDPPLARCYELTSCRGEIGRGDYLCGVEPTGKVYDDAGLPANVPKVYDCEGFRLPTDAEWEYAARAGTRTAFHSGSIREYGDYLQNSTRCSDDPNLERVGRYCWNSAGRAHPVKGLERNGWGLFDMLGNVSEWNNDRSDGQPATAPTDPDGEVQADVSRNVRGGSFDLWASACRLADQSAANKDYRHAAVGFRLARTLK